MADQHGFYVANRDFTAYTNKGFVIHFKKDEPKYVPPLVREEMLAHGVLPVDGDLPIREEEEKTAEPLGEDRLNKIYEGVLKVIETNEPKDFTAGGVPREDAFNRVAGFPAARREINAAYKKYLASQQSAE